MTPIQYGGCPDKKRKFRYRHTKREGHVKKIGRACPSKKLKRERPLKKPTILMWDIWSSEL